MDSKNYQMSICFNPFLLKKLLKYLEPKKEEKILDLGCGRGFYVKKIEKYTKKIVGVDISKKALARAVSPKIKYGDALDLKFEDNSFDKIYSSHLIEHIPDIKKAFAEMERVLKPGGKIILIYPLEPILGIQAIIPAIRIYKNPFAVRKIHLHKLKPEEIKKYIRNTSLIHLKSERIFILWTHYVTVLQKSLKTKQKIKN